MKHTTQEIEEMLGKITPGEWATKEVAHENPRRVYRMEIVSRQDRGNPALNHTRNICQIIDYYVWGDHPANAQFIAAAPSIIRNLLAELKEANHWRERWANEHKAIADQSQQRFEENANLLAENARLRKVMEAARENDGTMDAYIRLKDAIAEVGEK